MYSDSYTLIQRLLHWSIAILLVGLLAIGWILTEFEFKGLVEGFGSDVANALFKYHKTFGVIVLGLMLLRLACKLLLGKPEYSEPLPWWSRLASNLVHGLLYAALLAMPILGWAATAAGGFPVEFFDMKLPGFIGKDKALSELLYEYHGLIAYVIMGLAALHICAAFYHWLVRKDRVMGRMSLF